VLAHDRDEPGLGVWEVALPVAFDANPRDRTTALDTVLRIQRDVIFCLARDHTGVAADALIDIDDHAPIVTSKFFCRHLVTTALYW
jgi:hypothetical protein